MHAISYVRFSTPEQAKGDSYRRQIQLSEQYCKRKGLTLLEDGVYFDHGVSAFRGKNKTTGQLAQLLADAQAGHIPRGTRLIVESLDRLGRDGVLSQMGFFMNLLKEGLVIVTLGNGEAEYDEKADFTSLITALVVMSRANEESALKSERLKKAWEGKRKKIEDKPLTAIVPYWLEKKGEKIQTIPARVEVVQGIFAMAMKGMGRRAIAKQLNEQRIPLWSSTKRNQSGLWRDTYVQKILNNRAVLGEYQPHVKKDGKRVPVGEPLPDYFPAVIEEEIFLAVQEKISGRVRRGGREVYKAGNLFSGRLKCFHCGASLYFQNKGENVKWLTCENRYYSAAPCDSKAFRYEPLERAILGELVQINWNALLGREEPEVLASDRIAALNGKSKELEKKIENLLNVLADGMVSPALTKRLEIMEQELAANNREVEKIEKETRESNQKKRMASESSQMTEEFFALAQKPETRLELKRRVDDLLQKTYVESSEGEFRLALLFHGGGFSYKCGGIQFRYEKDEENLGDLLPEIMDGETLAKITAWEPGLGINVLHA